MLNQTKLIRLIEMELGYKFSELEISHDEIMDIIEIRTLPIFSKYYPYQERAIVNKETHRVDEFTNRFYLDTQNEVVGINQVVNASNVPFIGEGINAIPSPGRSAMGMGNILERQVNADLRSMSVNPSTYFLIEPNMIEIAPIPSGDMLVVCNVVHPLNLLTIPNNMTDVFTDLAVCDVKIALYPMRNRFNNLETTFGNLDLFIDDLQSARDDRVTLLERMQTSVVKTARRKKLWIV